MMTMMIQDVCFLYPNSFDSQKMNLGRKHWRIFKSKPILKVWRSDRKVISSAFYAVNHLDAHTRPAGQAERRPEADSQRTSTTSMADVVGTSSSLEEVCCQIRRSHAACWRKLDERDLRCGCGVPPARSLDLYLYSAEPARLWVARLFLSVWIAIKKFVFSCDTPQESLLLATFSAWSSSSSPVSD